MSPDKLFAVHVEIHLKNVHDERILNLTTGLVVKNIIIIQSNMYLQSNLSNDKRQHQQKVPFFSRDLAKATTMYM